MPQNARNTQRIEASSIKSVAPSAPNETLSMNGVLTEEEKMAEILKMGADQWVKQQEQMAT